jgi:autotransporter-associated beta strand protein
LTWTIKSTTQTGFEVFDSTNNLNWHLVATLAANATTYSDTNLVPASTYYYRVSAITATAISDYATTNVALGSVVAVNTDTWVGGTGNNFSTIANWNYSSSSGPVASGDSLVFAAAGSTTPNNDETGFGFPAISFAAGAQAYTIGGNAFTLGTSTAATVISVSSANAQTINNNITLGNAVQTISLGSGNLTLGGTVGGAGTASGLLVNSTNVLTIANAAFTGNLTVGQPSITGVPNGQLTINGGTFGSASSILTIAADLGTGSAVKSFILNGGTATFGPVNIATVGGETGAAMEIAGSGSASFGSVTNGSSSNTGGNITINTTGTVNLGNATLDRDNGANTYQTPAEGLVITAGIVTATNLFSSSSIGLRVADININGGSLTVGTSASTGAFKLGVANGAATGVGNAALTMTGGTLTYLGTDGLLVGNNATTANASYLVSITGSGAVANLTGITLNGVNSANQTNRLTLGGGATLYLGGAGLVVNQPGTYNNATFGTSIVGALADWSSSAPITLTGTTTFQAADSSAVAHNITLSGVLSGAGALTKTGGGTLTLSGANTYTGNTIVTNGTLALSGSGSIANSANIILATGAALDVSQTPSGLLTLANGQTLTGGGVVNGSVTTVANSTIVPGGLSVAGTLTVTNTATLGGNTIMLLNNAGNSSQLTATNINYGGTLTVSNIGPALAAGNSFNLFTAAGYSGAFANIILPALPAGLGWNTNALNTSGTLSVVVTASPQIGAISISGDGSGLIFGGTGGVANANYYLLATTNLAMPLANWTPVLTNQFDSNGDFNFTNGMDTNLPQGFYRLQIP